MVAVTKIEAKITTGAEDPDDDVKIFLGFEIPDIPVAGFVRSREFRLKQGRDANPFRSNTVKSLIFGTGANVDNLQLNDPTNPQLDDGNIIGAYIRISPKSEDSWNIVGGAGNTFVQVNNNAMKTYTLAANITLQEDSGERVSL
jgi:hypothetical protein